MKILFVVFAQPGHLNPMIPVAQRLHRDGHEIGFFAYDPIRTRLERAGLPVRSFAVRAEDDPRSAPPRSRRTRALVERSRDPRWVVRWTRLNLIDGVPAQIEALERAVDELQPDVLCTDPLNYAAPVVAERRGIPWACVASNLMSLAPVDYRGPLIDIDASLVEARDEVLGSCASRLRFHAAEVISPYLNTAFTTEAFVPRRLSANDWSHLVGPSTPLGARGDEAPFAWDRLPDGVPLVYVAFGGGEQLSFGADFFRTLGAALRPDEAQIILALGDLLDDPFVPPLPAHVQVTGYAPQRELLARADVFVTHGGANSVMESLSAGTPMLVLPLAHEQPLQAVLVEQSGAGIAAEAAALGAAQARELLTTLLSPDGSHRRRAGEIARSYALHDGAQATADLLLRLAHDRLPLPP